MSIIKSLKTKVIVLVVLALFAIGLIFGVGISYVSVKAEEIPDLTNKNELYTQTDNLKNLYQAIIRRRSCTGCLWRSENSIF